MGLCVETLQDTLRERRSLIERLEGLRQVFHQFFHDHDLAGESVVRWQLDDLIESTDGFPEEELVDYIDLVFGNHEFISLKDFDNFTITAIKSLIREDQPQTSEF